MSDEAKTQAATGRHEALVQEFLALDRQRVRGDPPLELSELTRWQELCDVLASELGAIPGASGNLRESLRVPTHLKVLVSFGAAQQLLAVYNLSEGGVFLAAARPLPVGSALAIEFWAPGGTLVELEGRVVWVRNQADERGPVGMGVALEALSDWDRVLLAEVVQAVLDA
jgi:uncharacterized protein (TIGR02266 family)